MCTMTWFTKADGYELFFNRDERLSRSQAALPTVQTTLGVNHISPTDADAGGTWISINEYGITVCLLNHYQFEQIATYKDWISRGEIVRKFSPTIDIASAAEEFATMLLDDYRAFRMFMIDRRGNNRLCVWDGHTARVEQNVSTPKSSSSVDAKHVKEVRKRLFENLYLGESQDSQAYINYHASHLPNRSQESVCMHRDDAKTVSLSHVSVSATAACFAYADGSPCEAMLGEPLELLLSDDKVVRDLRVTQLAAVT